MQLAVLHKWGPWARERAGEKKEEAGGKCVRDGVRAGWLLRLGICRPAAQSLRTAPSETSSDRYRRSVGRPLVLACVWNPRKTFRGTCRRMLACLRSPRPPCRGWPARPRIGADPEGPGATEWFAVHLPARRLADRIATLGT